MGYAKLIAVIALSCITPGCSTNASPGSLGSPALGVRFEHRAERRSDGKSVLVVFPMTEIVDNRVHLDREAQAYAGRYANQACPKGHDFDGSAPIANRGNERTFVFRCR